jgi:hypothetical protein
MEMIIVDYNEPDHTDELLTRYYSKSSGGVYARDECKKPFIKRISKHSKNSCCADAITRRKLEEAICPICRQKPIPDDTVLYTNPNNGSINWLCNTCKRLKVWKWNCWHYLPAHRRREKSIDTEKLLFDYVVAHNGMNINQLKDLLGWSYGKVRGACMRLQTKGHVKIEQTTEHGYRESKVYQIINKI